MLSIWNLQKLQESSRISLKISALFLLSHDETFSVLQEIFYQASVPLHTTSEIAHFHDEIHSKKQQ